MNCFYIQTKIHCYILKSMNSDFLMMTMNHRFRDRLRPLRPM